MSDWEERLKAVATLANRPRPMDGEVYCANRTCGNRRLNRTDMTCWVCGWDRFIPASEEMRQSHRFTFVTPPRLEEKPKAEPPKPQVTPQGGGSAGGLTFQEWVDHYNKKQATASAKPSQAAQFYTGILKQYQQIFEQSYQRQLAVAGLFPKPAVQISEPTAEPKATFGERVRKLFGGR